MSTADPAVWALVGVVGGWAVMQGAIEWFRYRARRRAWEEYERRRDGVNVNPPPTYPRPAPPPAPPPRKL